MRRGENLSTQGKTSQNRGENQQTQPTYDAKSGNRTRATLVRGECSHHYATTALTATTGSNQQREKYLSIEKEGGKINFNVTCIT